MELLAGIPSIVYGMWGLFVLAPWFALHVQLPLMTAIPAGSIWEKVFYGVPNGANIFTASLILAIMILPYMAATIRELFLTVPAQVRESAYGIGCTPFEVVRSVIVPYVRSGMVGVVMLGLGRALGETMAVTFIIGNAHGLPQSLFDSGSTLASTIANEFTEATGEMHTAALIGAGPGAVRHHLQRPGHRPRAAASPKKRLRSGMLPPSCSTDAPGDASPTPSSWLSAAWPRCWPWPRWA